jgi:hypothetical protein
MQTDAVGQRVLLQMLLLLLMHLTMKMKKKKKKKKKPVQLMNALELK